MTSPVQLLRVTYYWAFGLGVAALVMGYGWGALAGGAVAVANLLLMWFAVSGLAPHNFAFRLMAVHLGAFSALAWLLDNLPAAPVLVGFCAPVCAAAQLAVAGLRRPPSLPSLSAEHG